MSRRRVRGGDTADLNSRLQVSAASFLRNGSFAASCLATASKASTACIAVTRVFTPVCRVIVMSQIDLGCIRMYHASRLVRSRSGSQKATTMRHFSYTRPATHAYGECVHLLTH